MSNGKKASSGSDLRVFYILGGLIIVALAYFFGFSKLSSKASDIAALNESKQTTVDQLNSMVSRKDEIIQVTNDDIEKTAEIAEKYPVKYEEENEIVFVKDLEEKSGIIVKAIDMTTNEEMDMTSINALASSKAGSMYQSVALDSAADSASDDSADTASTEDATVETTAEDTSSNEDTGVGAKTSVELSITTKYDDIRSALDYIYSQKDKMGVSSIMLQHDEQTGKLVGTMKIVMYSIENIGHEYKVPTPQEILPPINGNIFKSK